MTNEATDPSKPLEIVANGYKFKITGLNALIFTIAGLGLFGAGAGAKSLMTSELAALQTRVQQNCEEIKALRAFQKEVIDLLHKIDTRVAILAQKETHP